MDIQKIFHVIELAFDEEHTIDYDKIRLYALRIGLRMEYGASKICLIDPHSNWVVKIDKDRKEKSCEREYFNYKEAQKLGIQKAFLDIHFLGYGPYYIPIFAQRKIDVVIGNLSSDTYKDKISSIPTEDIYQIMRYFDTRDDVWFGMALLLYGKEFMRKVTDFIYEYGINDLHEYNLGYLNGKPVIMDYSGI